MTTGLRKSAEKLSKLYKKLIAQEDSSYEIRNYQHYRNMHRKLERRSKVTYY